MGMGRGPWWAIFTSSPTPCASAPMWPMPAMWWPCRRPGGWQRNGFEVVGTLPGAFSHKQLGYVDPLVMVQGLVEGPIP